MRASTGCSRSRARSRRPNAESAGVRTDATITGEFKLIEGLLPRVEFRRDMSDTAVFTKDTGAAVKSQITRLRGQVGRINGSTNIQRTVASA